MRQSTSQTTRSTQQTLEEHLPGAAGHVADHGIDAAGPQKHLADQHLRRHGRDLQLRSDRDLRAHRRFPLRDGDHRADPGGQLHPGQRQHRQQLRADDLRRHRHRADAGAVVHAGDRQCRQQLHRDPLQHGDDDGRAGRHLQCGAGHRRHRLHRDHLLGRHDRPDCRCRAARRSLPSSGNAWTQTSCTFPTTGPTAVSSCTPVAASSGNSWTATTCATVTTTNVPVASCTRGRCSGRQQLDDHDLQPARDDQRADADLLGREPPLRATPGRPRPARPTTRPTCRWRPARRRPRPPATAGPPRPVRRRPRPVRPAWPPARRWPPRPATAGRRRPAAPTTPPTCRC